MLSGRIRAQVTAFIAVALAAIAFIGFNYVGLGRLFADSGYTVTLRLAEGGGLYTEAEVTYRGVGIGEVDDMRLTDDGMEAVLFINDSAPPIPADTKAVVADRSAIGEQYVDLQPRSSGKPYLHEGSVLGPQLTQIPPPEGKLLANIKALAQSVPREKLRTVVDEMYQASRSVGPELQTLLDSASSFTDAAADALPETTKLINDGSTALRTQVDSAQDWRRFARNIDLFAGKLAGSDEDLRELIAKAPPAATQLAELLKDTDPEMSVLLANLLTTARLFTTRTDGMEQMFATLPKAVAATSTAITPDGGHMSVALTFWDPPPCRAGYEGTTYRKGEIATPAPFNTDAKCSLPYGSASSVRGSQNAPSGGVPDAAVPGSTGTANPAKAAALSHVSTTLGELLGLTE